MRKFYLDHIRWATVMLVLVYHVCYIFNGVGVPGAIPGARSISALDRFACIVYPWMMVLLFVIAGISARYALQKRTGTQFLKERATKLLIPSTLGLFVIHWITGYCNLKMGGGLDFIPTSLVYPIAAVSGIGPLWFIQMLFLFSCILVLLRTIDKADRVWTLCGNVNLPILLLLAMLMLGSSQLFNIPVLTMYRFGIYLASFLIGYYVLSHETVQQLIERIHLPMLVLAVVCAVFYGLRYGGTDYTAPACLQSVFTNCYLWVAVLAILGCGRKYANRETTLTKSMTRSGFGLYILHYVVLTVTCYILHYHCAFPAAWNYVIALVVEFSATVALYELIRRIPIVRFLVLGIAGRAISPAVTAYKSAARQD